MRKYDRFQYILRDLHQLSPEQLEAVVALINHFMGYSRDIQPEFAFDIAANDDYPF